MLLKTLVLTLDQRRISPRGWWMIGKYAQHFLWITDPWDTLDHSKDTTLRLAEEALTLGYASSWCDVRTIRWFDNSTLLDTYSIESISPSRQKDSFKFAGLLCLPPHRFASIQYRTDPPVDAAYIYPLQLLVIGIEKAELEGHVEREAVQIVNPPSVLLMTNEKLEQALIGDLMPLTLVATEWSQLLEFGLA